ncbi:MAG TPA: ABC transporter permease [Kineosporiaceae bacterium]|nr:ABC transporter permease [Kineosporiaceae bacterium]
MTTVPISAAADRRVPPLGGFNLTFLGLEIRRLLRNRRTVIFTLILPAAFFFMFGSGQTDPAARAYVLVSLGVYGAMIATTSGGAMVSIERAQGWSRQLRLTPLRPVAYIAIKVITAMVLGLASVVVDFAIGAAVGVHLTATQWIVCGLVAWLGALVFAAFGLFAGYLLPSENVMQILGPVLALLAFAGGLFVPLQFLDPTVQSLAKMTPAYGVGELARIPLTHDALGWAPVLNIVVWLGLFVVGAALLFRRDTRRV